MGSADPKDVHAYVRALADVLEPDIKEMVLLIGLDVDRDRVAIRKFMKAVLWAALEARVAVVTTPGEDDDG